MVNVNIYIAYMDPMGDEKTRLVSEKMLRLSLDFIKNG